MLEWISWFIISLAMICADNYVYSKITNVKYPKINFKFLILTIVLALTVSYSSSFLDYKLKIYFNFVTYIIYFKFMYKQTYEKTVITEFFIYIFAALAEIIFSTIVIGALKINPIIFTTDTGAIFAINAFFIIFPIFLISLKPVSKLIKLILEWYDEKKTLNLCVFASLTLYVITKVLLQSQNLSNISILQFFVNNSIVIVFLIFIFFFFKAQTSNKRLSKEYDKMLENVQNYESLIEEQYKITHEFRNQLVIIKDMVNSKTTQNYINELLTETEENTISQYRSLQYLPSGGLKGLLFDKIKKMEKNSIEYYLDVDKKFASKKVNNVCQESLKDVSKILGVFLDNAIEACAKIANKKIIVEAYCKGQQIVFAISNTFEGNIEFSKLDDGGYTTKGKGKGYGLSLVQDILKKHSNFENVREVNSIYFTQKLIIK